MIYGLLICSALAAAATPAQEEARDEAVAATPAREARDEAWRHASLDKTWRRSSVAATGEWGPWLARGDDGNDAAAVAAAAAAGGLRALQPSSCSYSRVSGVCGPASACDALGTAAYTTRNLTFDATVGLFRGTITTNQCPHSSVENTYLGVLRTTGLPDLTCSQQCYPAVTSLPAPAPLRGAIGFTVRGGLNVYGPLDAGFFPNTAAPNICSPPAVASGMCPAGTDVEICYAGIEYACGTANAAPTGFATGCGNHANPSHYHTALSCDYNPTDASGGHSPLLAVIKDGRGLYGRWEDAAAAQLPVLDACNGHFGPVPDFNASSRCATCNGKEFGTSFIGGTANSVYHYHVTSGAPFTVGCYGPVASLAQAKALYSTCAASATPQCPGCGSTTNTTSQASMLSGSTFSVCTSRGAAKYQIDCPVFRHEYKNGSVELNNQVAPTDACPVCAGNCSFPPPAPAAPSPSAEPVPGATASAGDALSAAAIGGAAAGGALGLAVIALAAKLLLGGGAKAAAGKGAAAAAAASGGYGTAGAAPWGNTVA